MAFPAQETDADPGLFDNEVLDTIPPSIKHFNRVLLALDQLAAGGEGSFEAPLAKIALKFGPFETFALAFLGLTCISSLAQGSIARAASPRASPPSRTSSNSSRPRRSPVKRRLPALPASVTRSTSRVKGPA